MTSSSGGRGDLVFLDACCLINLVATGRVEEILTALPYRFAVARYVVEEEVLEIGAEEGTVASPSESRRMSLHPLLADLVEKDVLEKLDVTSEEEEIELVRFAAELDDGEAHTCALALVRGARVATDDRKAIRVLRSAWESRGQEEEPVLRTSEFLFSWARGHGLAEPEMGQLVQAIGRRASFFPPRNDPHFKRWMALLRREE